MVGFIIFAVISVGLLGYGLYQTVNLVKTEMIDVDFDKVIKKTLLFVGGFAISFTLMLVMGMIWSFSGDAVHYIKLIVGGLIFGFSFPGAIHAFILFYYGKNVPEKWHKRFYVFFIIAFVVAFLSLFLWLDGYAPYLEYPLVNGFNFEKGFVRAGQTRPNLAFYALCILSGAILVYFMCDHFLYQEYGKHGIIESTFIVAFPAGIIGARIWYCIGEGLPIEDWIKIWEGGLTILGGATMGIVAGVAWFMWRNKKYSIWVAVDCIVPTILIAQAVGRFGNFFNCEVHGNLTAIENFKWLPEIIWRNMQFSESVGAAPEGKMYVPLFFIEALVNFVGYFVLAHVFGKKLRKFTEQGDLCFGYIVWYGMTRVLMEPLRHTNYNMGEDGYWSWIWSLLFVAGGCLVIFGNHLVRYLLKKKKNNYVVVKNDEKVGLLETICFAIIALGLLIPGIILMASNSFSPTIGFNSFNIGLILLVTGISVLFFAPLSGIRFFEAKRKLKNA